MASSSTATSTVSAPITASETPNQRGIPLAPFISDVAAYISQLPDPPVQPKPKLDPSSSSSSKDQSKDSKTDGESQEGEVESSPIQRKVEATLSAFQELISKYQFMELSTTRRLAGLREKVPEVEKTLQAVEFLASRNDSKDGAEDGEDDDDLDDDLDSEKGSGEGGEIEAFFELQDTLYAKAAVGKVEEVCLWLGANTMLSYPLKEAQSLLQDKLLTAKKSVENCLEDLDFLREQITTMEVAIARVYNWDVGRRRGGANAGSQQVEGGDKKTVTAKS